MKKLFWVRNGKENHDMKKFFAAFFAFVLGVFSLLASGIFCTCPVFGDDTNMGITKCKFPGELSDIRVELKLPHAQKFSPGEIKFFDTHPRELMMVFALCDLYKKKKAPAKKIHIFIKDKKIRADLVFRAVKKVFPETEMIMTAIKDEGSFPNHSGIPILEIWNFHEDGPGIFTLHSRLTDGDDSNELNGNWGYRFCSIRGKVYFTSVHRWRL